MVREEDESESSGPRSPASLPTEYGRSYRPVSAPRPRRPQSGWQTRNVSNILPTTPEPPPVPARPLRGRPQNFPWVTRQPSQIFPQAPQPYPGPGVGNNRSETTDANNNPVFETGRPRRRQQWPWEERARTSSIFYSDAITAPSASGTQSQSSSQNSSRPQSAPSRWPWQERARQSVIFDVLTSKDPVKLPRHRKYEWDQRQSNSISACIQQGKDEPPPSSSGSRSHCHQYPWQERANSSVVFKSPEEPTFARQPKYLWDQRKTRFSVKLDPDAQFSKASNYSDNYSNWQKVQSDRIRPAGKPCYKEEDVDLDSQKKLRSGKRRARNKQVEKKGSSGSVSIILPLPAPPSPPSPGKAQVGSNLNPSNLESSSSVIRGSSCLELVPADFDFSVDKIPKNGTQQTDVNGNHL